MNKLLGIMLTALLMFSVQVNADVYKWKDKDGTVRYSDTPPPSNVQQLSISGKKASGGSAAATSPPVQAPAASSPTGDVKKNPAVSPEKTRAVSTEGEAIKRQEKAEQDKKNAEQADAELKVKQQNCASAKSRLASYKQGGRIYKINEKGEREFESDASIAENLAAAQQDVEKYCE